MIYKHAVILLQVMKQNMYFPKEKTYLSRLVQVSELFPSLAV